MFQDLTQQLRESLLPKSYFAWQTLLLLSIFSLVIAAVLDAVPDGTDWAVELLTTFSWMFFTAAIWWLLTDKPIKVNNYSISPWLVGALLCLFLFRPWTDNRFRWAISTWPMISTAIKALPSFIQWDLKVKVPKREQQQVLLMTTLINLLLSCWILFTFRVQDWVANYPSLLVSNFENSAFVYDFEADSRREPSPGSPQSPPQGFQGVTLLNKMVDAIQGDLADQPWYQTERWLYTRQDRLQVISQRALNGLTAPDEATFWRMSVLEPRRSGDGYQLTLRAVWQGPVSHDAGFFVERTCNIAPENRVRSVPIGGTTARTTSSPNNTSTSGGESSERQPPSTSQLTRVDCGDDTPDVQWIKAGV